MLQKLAVKRLTASDLTFFHYQYNTAPAGKQKAINLNADVFIDMLYPSLPVIAQQQGDRVPLDLNLYGPGLAGLYNLQRKIVKGESYKNWRLNGELVHNPPEHAERFDRLVPGDFAVFSFLGDIQPHAASVFFIAQAFPEDRELHNEFSGLVGAGQPSMKQLTLQQLEEVIQRADPPEEHPLRELLLDEALQDAAQNGIRGIRTLRTRPSTRRVTPENLRQARENAARVGRRGEEFVNSYLFRQKAEGRITDFSWVSDDNAVSPYDFEVETNAALILVDVKSTEGEFDSPIHISLNELLQMQLAAAYDLYRVYEAGETEAKLRIIPDMKAFAERVLSTFEGLPSEVHVDSISVSPSILSFGDELLLSVLNEED